MKKGIHPSYKSISVRCACGNKMDMMSTSGGINNVEVCSNCHPFFTQKHRLVDTGGRIGRFRKRMEQARGCECGL